ncbi:MAG: hypothetical protein KDC34_02910 [Saprospiraceae bacterium]|nr:hypothetical protein [Saprospiraceae bacterium]
MKQVLLISSAPVGTQEEMVSNMIKALKLDLHEHIHVIVLTPSDRISLIRYCRDTAISKVLVFGLAPEQLSLHIKWPNYQVLELSGLQLLFGQTLEEVAQKKEIKIKLWNALQQMFPLG